MLVIPAINETEFSEILQKIRKAEEFLPDDGWVQIDAADGVFTERRTWLNPADLGMIETRLGLELHIMVESVDEALDAWLAGLVSARAPRKRLIAHLEAMGDVDFVMNACARAGVELGLALNPGTPVDLVASYADRFALVQLLAVPPGAAGQSFDQRIIEKTKALRQKSPDVIIEIDGGVNLEVAKAVKVAGADIIVAASYIWNNPSPKVAYEELSSI
jgi:ribulose-phosphate 3-epimerase